MSSLLRYWPAGVVQYERAYHIQKILAKRHKIASDTSQNVLLFVEHPPVYTVGIRTDQYSSAEEEKLKGLGADFQKTNRGGLITFHGPGQLVVYPIINLRDFGLGIRTYVCKLEQVVMQTCRHFGVTNVRTSREPNETGVWVDNAKVCAIGVHASRYITSHGLALNCSTDLSWFGHIVPCGLVGKEVTSLSKLLNTNMDVKSVAPVLLKAFCDNLQATTSNFTFEEQQEVLNEMS